MHCEKWTGLGNDYLIVAQRDIPASLAAPAGGLLPAAIRLICDRHFGLGGDGILVLDVPGPDGHDASMLVHNPDGGDAEMCGNGIRMAARYLLDRELVATPAMTIATAGGTIRPHVMPDGQVQVDMGRAVVSEPDHISIDPHGTHAGRRISMGNPHFVISGDPATTHLELVGPLLETHPAFPNRTNVEFWQPTGPARVAMRVWERGVGETMACGTGACAVAVAAVIDGGLPSPVAVDLPGGTLLIAVDDDLQVTMTGPASHIYTATVAAELLEAARAAIAGDNRESEGAPAQPAVDTAQEAHA